MSANRSSARARLIAIGLTGAALVAVSASGLLRHDTVDTPTIERARAALESAGCTLTTVRAVPNERDHSDVVSPDQRVPQWNTDPPTSGPHYGEPAVYGIYTEPVQQARLVHNLEHGAVFIQYGSAVSRADIAAITTFYAAHPAGTVVAPYPRLGKQIALGAWIAGSARGTGVLGRCPAFRRKAFETFFETFQFNGNERFPPSSMQPGGT